MFMLYALVLGLICGLLLGGQVERIGNARLRWLPAIAAALIVQALLFGPLQGLLQPADPVGIAAHVLSSAVVLVAVLVNVRLPGLALLAAGAAMNLAAIIANGGVMPASDAALATLGWTGEPSEFSNSAFVENPALPWLTDIFALPRWLPFANVFSIGDVLISLGVGVFIVRSMGRPSARSASVR